MGIRTTPKGTSKVVFLQVRKLLTGGGGPRLLVGVSLPGLQVASTLRALAAEVVVTLALPKRVHRVTTKIFRM